MDYDKIISLLQALKEGKELQWYTSSGKWENFRNEALSEIHWIVTYPNKVRIKPEPIKQPLPWQELCRLVAQKAPVELYVNGTTYHTCLDGIIAEGVYDNPWIYVKGQVFAHKLQDLIRSESLVNGNKFYTLVDAE